MLELGSTFVFTVLLWWLSTGVILLLCALPRRTFGWSLLGGFVVFVAALGLLVDSARTVSSASAYLSFLAAIGVWGWLEMNFLMGYVTGPRTTPCPSDARGWHRFRLAVGALLYHELSIIAAALLVTLLTWGAPNQTGTFAFLILMVMRISAKLNIFLGVPNLTDEFLPKRLSYLKSYFRKRSFNLLFPVSIAGSALVAIALGQKIYGAEGAEAVGSALLLALISLAILEHLFMILPLPDAALWSWVMPVTPAARNVDKHMR